MVGWQRMFNNRNCNMDYFPYNILCVMKCYDDIKDKYRITKAVEEIRAEMKKPNPDGEKIFRLLCGDKYNRPING